MAIEYCNTTSDLDLAYPNIDQFQHNILLENWTKTAGKTNVYQKGKTGNVSQIFEDGIQYTVKTTVDLVEGTASTYFYDTDTDVLYIHTSGSDAASGYDITAGEDWDAFKLACRNQAQEKLDSFLKVRFNTPLIPKTGSVHTSNDYEYDVMNSAALLTCWIIIKRVDLTEANKLFKQVWNKDPGDDETKGIVNMILDGEIQLQDQITAREAGGHTIVPDHANNSLPNVPRISGEFTGTEKRIWRIMVDTAGAPGTGTFKVSYDGGTTWDQTLQDMKDADTDDYRMYIYAGIYIEWPNVSWAENDDFDVTLYPISDLSEVVSRVGSMDLVR